MPKRRVSGLVDSTFWVWALLWDFSLGHAWSSREFWYIEDKLRLAQFLLLNL